MNNLEAPPTLLDHQGWKTVTGRGLPNRPKLEQRLATDYRRTTNTNSCLPVKNPPTRHRQKPQPLGDFRKTKLVALGTVTPNLKMASEVDSFENFTQLSSKITQLLYGRTNNNRVSINKTLDELNSINYNYPVVSIATKAVLLLHQCCSLIPPEDTELVVKCCRLIATFIAKQMVVVEGRTFTIAVQWCLEALKTDEGVVDIFTALEALLRVNPNREGEVIKSVVETISRIRGKDVDSTLAALQCLETCFASSLDDSSEQLRIGFQIFLNQLAVFEGTSTKINEIKILTTCLHGIQNVLTQKPELFEENEGIILGIIKTYMVFNLKDVNFMTPEKLLPSTLSIPEPAPNINPREKGGKLTKLRKQKKHKDSSTKFRNYNEKEEQLNESVASFSQVKTSDSDFSDTEGGNLAKMGNTCGRTRQSALALFLQITKISDKYVMFSYWSSFIPENSQSGKHNLATCFLKDPSARGRVLALQVLLSLITNAKVYLAQAEKGEKLSFTPFSVTIGLMIKELHKCLSLALIENLIPVLTQVLKCWSGLVQSTPYHKLPPGLMTKAIRNMKPFIYHKDATIQVGALIGLGCALASEPCVLETKIAFTGTQQNEKPVKRIQENHEDSEDSLEYADFSSDENDDCSLTRNREIPWILDKVLVNLGLSNDQIIEGAVATIKLESLLIISAICRNYFECLLAPHLTRVTRALNLALSDRSLDVQLHAGRAIDFIGQAMGRYFVCEDTTPKTLGPLDGLSFWQTLLNGELTALLQVEENRVLRAVGCDCLGSIGSVVFEQLPRDKQILCITLLFAFSRDEENNVKSAAVRSLGISVLYSSLREDLGFIVDASEAIHRLIQDENSGVRIKASWSLGNLSETLALSKSNPILLEEFPKNELLKLIRVTIKSAENIDAIKMNIVRALGNFLNLITDDFLKVVDFRNVVSEAFKVLIKNCTSSNNNMKVRWNSCYALGNAMKNSALFTPILHWTPSVFNVLCDLVANFHNFKVRTNAAVALSSPVLREHYGSFYFQVWIALVKALETSQNMIDFSEYKHRDHLVEQICLSMGYLTTLSSREDLDIFKDNVGLDSEFLKGFVRKVWDRLLPEKSTILLEAQSHLNVLGNELNLSEDEKCTLKQLEAIFKLEPDFFQ